MFLRFTVGAPRNLVTRHWRLYFATVGSHSSRFSGRIWSRRWYQPITTAVITDACLNTRWHHGAYTSPKEDIGPKGGRIERLARSGSCRESVRVLIGTMNAARSRPGWLATVQSGRKQAQSRVCTPGFTHHASTGLDWFRICISYSYIRNSTLSRILR